MDNTKKSSEKTIYRVYQNFGRGDEFMQSFTSKKKALSFAKYVFDSYVDNFIKKNRGVEFDIINSALEHSNPYYFEQDFSLCTLSTKYFIFSFRVYSSN